MFRVRQLKALIKDTFADAFVKEVRDDRILLTVEGGDVLKKTTPFLNEVGIKDGSTIIVEIFEKLPKGAPIPSEPKLKVDPKIKICYSVRKDDPPAFIIATTTDNYDLEANEELKLDTAAIKEEEDIELIDTMTKIEQNDAEINNNNAEVKQE